MTKFGEPNPSPEQPERSRLRLWVQQHVNYPYDDCCLIWPFGRHRDGYGVLSVDGEMTYAHRYMCRLVNGEPPTPEHEASHSCNRGHDACVSPHHLDWKTPGANHREGEWHPKIKINADQAREIRDLKGLEVVSITAERYGISPITVRQIQAGRIWRTDCRRGTNSFTDEQIQRIRSLKDSGQTQTLADEFGVSYQIIWKIMNRKNLGACARGLVSELTMPKLSKFFDQENEPDAICRNCEYFDGGGMGQDGVPINFEGDCLNRHSSPRFTTNQDQTCKGFWPCSTRWPDCDDGE